MAPGFVSRCDRVSGEHRSSRDGPAPYPPKMGGSVDVLVVERERHFRAEDLRPLLPGSVVHDAKTVAEALPVAASCDVLVALAHNVTDELVAAMPKLSYIVSLSAGVDHLWTLPSLRADVRITNGRGIHGPQMAEMAFLYMIGLSRDYRRMEANQRAHVWDRWAQPVLLGKTVVLAGIGAISEEIAQRCKAFGMQVVGISNARTEAPGFDRIVPRARLMEAVADADFLIVLVPLDASTRHMIDASVFAAMKPTAHLINLARGDVIDEPAMVEALETGQIAGAGLDVFSVEPLPRNHPLWDMPNVMISPRIGGMSDIYDRQILPLVTHNLIAWRDGRPDDLKNVVR
jgi:D-2-hydroxyacid dehydrogenase (NADP+)